MNIKEYKMRLIDSVLFMSMKLSELPGALGLDTDNDISKGFFPHLFTSIDNMSYVGAYPEKSDYGYDYMSNRDRIKFEEWYETKTNQIFDMRLEMELYCTCDVDILRLAVVEFRRVFIDSTRDECGIGIDPFNSVTMSSCCMTLFRTLLLEET